jgi:hypothetical protein
MAAQKVQVESLEQVLEEREKTGGGDDSNITKRSASGSVPLSMYLCDVERLMEERRLQGRLSNDLMSSLFDMFQRRAVIREDQLRRVEQVRKIEREEARLSKLEVIRLNQIIKQMQQNRIN